MARRKLKIKGIETRIKRVKKERADLVYCDKEGRELEKKAIQHYKSKYIYEDTEEEWQGEGKPYKKKKEKDEPMKKLQQKKEVKEDEIEWVDISEKEDLLTEKTYWITAPKLLKEKLKEKAKEGKIMNFIFHFAGYKPYQTYVYLYDNVIFMELGRGYKSEQLEKMKEQEGLKEEIEEEIEEMENEVKKAKAKELI